MVKINVSEKASAVLGLVGFFISAGILALFPSHSFAESATMKSGKVIEGAVVQKDDESVMIKKDDGEVFVIPFSMMEKGSAETLRKLPNKKEEPPPQAETNSSVQKNIPEEAKASPTPPAVEGAAKPPMQIINTACVGKSGKRRNHRVLNVSVCIPSDWTETALDPSVSNKSMAFQDGQGRSVVLNLDPQGVLNDRYALVRKANGPIVEEGELETPYFKARWFVYDRKDNRTVIYMFQDASNRIFSLIASAQSSKFYEFRSLFDDISKSFQVSNGSI